MSFNGRRVSRDRGQMADLLARCGGRRLWAAPMSAGLLAGTDAAIVEEPLAQAAAGDVCFVEQPPHPRWPDRVEQLWVYRWERTYPADTWLDLAGFRLEETAQVEGTSHPCITLEIYRRKDRHGNA